MAETIVAELRAFCAQLLESGPHSRPKGSGEPVATDPESVRQLITGRPSRQGLHRSNAATQRTGGSTFGTMLRQVEAATALVPHLLSSLESATSSNRFELVSSPTPMRARMPRHAAAFDYVGGRLLPRRWDCATPTLAVDLAPLGFVLFVLQLLATDFERVRSRLAQHIEEAKASRQGTSQWAQHEAEDLDSLQARLDGAGMRLARAEQSVHLVTGGKVSPIDRLPHPFPRSRSWESFRQLADVIRFPNRSLSSKVRGMLEEPTATADLPFLYQRWVSMRLVQELTGTFGYRLLREPFGPLFLGGRVPMEKDGVEIELWVEPRLSAGEHPCGLGSSGAETTPDFVLITPGQGGKDAFVLDATLSVDPTVLARKSGYRERLCFSKFRPIAGVPGRRRPLRAWAVAPIADEKNRLDRPDGSAGCVPMVPGRAVSERMVRAWLRDAVEHGEAWGVRRPADMPQD